GSHAPAQALGQRLAELALGQGQSPDAAAGALGVGVLEHAVAIDLGRVVAAQQHGAPARLVAAEAAVVVLAVQHELDRRERATELQATGLVAPSASFGP